MVWICTDYADLRLHLYGSKEAYDLLAKESALLTSSHRGDLDWLGGFVLGAHYEFLHVSRKKDANIACRVVFLSRRLS